MYTKHFANRFLSFYFNLGTKILNVKSNFLNSSNIKNYLLYFISNLIKTTLLLLQRIFES